MADQEAEPVLDDELEPVEIEDQTEDEAEPQGEDDVPEISFEDEAAPASDGESETGLVAQLRAANRKQAKELLALKTGGAAPQQTVVGEKPTFEGCEYDPERFETELAAWTERSNAARREEEERQAVWQRELDQVNAQRAALKIPPADYDKSSGAVKEALTDLQTAVLVRAAKNPAALIFALGKSPSKLDALAAIADPVKLSAEIGRLETSIKMTSRRTAPPPEGIVRGSAPLSQPGADKTLERLEKEAERTGDRTKVVQYKRSLKAKAK